MAQQTAVDWLIDRLLDGSLRFEETKMGFLISMNNNEIEQAKAMEKEQIKNSFNDGYCKGDEELSWDDIEKYYNETYNK
jgi:hypothetical protein